MGQITVIYTKRNWNPVSWLIRYCIPRSRFALSVSSHCLIVDGDYLIEANMLHAVRRVPYDEAMKGLTIVDQVSYDVPDAEAGLSWAREQAAEGKGYDFKGAFGLLAPDRNWQEDDSWFCYELAAATLVKSGRQDFRDSVVHITGTLLMAIKPQ